MDLSIIIVSYNTRELTLACLRSLFEQTKCTDFEVIIVDNASTDGSADAIAAEFPQIRLMRRSDNLGFAAANNLAARDAIGAYLLLLNPDTIILDGAIRKLHGFARAYREASIFGGRTLFPDGSLNSTSCWGQPTPWSMFCLATGLSGLFKQSKWAFPEEMRGWQRDTVRSVDIVTGCFLLLRRELWEALGGFDPTFFMYGEETDLCLRAAKLGQRCVIYPDATIIHYGGASERVRADKLVRILKTKGQLFRKHWRRSRLWFGLAMLRVWAFSRMVAFGVAQLIRPEMVEWHEAWRTVWRRRDEWCRP